MSALGATLAGRGDDLLNTDRRLRAESVEEQPPRREPRAADRATAHPVIRRPVPGVPMELYILTQLPLAAAWAVLTLVHYVCLLYLLFAGMGALADLIPPGDPANALTPAAMHLLHEVMTAPRDMLGKALIPPGAAPISPMDVLLFEGAVLISRKAAASASSEIRRRQYPAPNRLPIAVARTTLPGVIPRPATDPAETPAHDSLAAARQRRTERITAVHDALAQLDAEWLSYEIDLEAYYLTKPVLHDASVPETATYQSALYELRELAGGLGHGSNLAEIAAAERAAETALLAWGTANDHAAAVGLTDRPPTERAALKRLYALTGQLADLATPKPMWPSLIAAITREMNKLANSTIAVSWEHLARVPELEHRNPAALTTRTD